MKRNHIVHGLLALLLALPGTGMAQIVADDFTQASAQNDWVSFLGACLTAGDNTGTIPACIGNPYYTELQVGGVSGRLPDPAGSGALRFTNGRPGGYNQAGSIISNFTFPAGAGLQVIFKTISYRGDSGGGVRDGADGMSFALLDGAVPPFDTGAFGGSLGYTCSNVNNDGKLHPDGSPRAYDGIMGGYLGLGIDEYGNFLNQGDNTATGWGYQGNRIGLRGAGSITWRSLTNATATSPYYPATLTLAQRAAAVQNTCRTGTIWDYSNPRRPVNTGTPLMDYPAIPNAYKVLTGLTIANEAARTRGEGTPITYNLKITQDGLLSFSYSVNGGAYQPVITKQSITASNGPLPASFRFGFSGSTGGSTNIHEILCFQASPADLADTSVGINQKEATKIAGGTQAYLAFYYPSNWTGRLTANDLLYNASTQQVTVRTTANWDARCNLTGVSAPKTCVSTGATNVVAQAPASRSILTWNGTQGIPFEWGSISAGMQSVLDAGDASQTADRLNYLRGDRSNEVDPSGVGLFRARESVLADIVDSSPTWVGPPNSPYTLVWSDRIHAGQPAPENGANSYSSFVAARQTRLNVVYAGSNDGLLHGFESGSYDASGNYVNSAATPNDGKEVLAYMPGAVFNAIHNSVDPTLDYANTQYSHAFFVDATPDADDLYYANAWHTWLVGGLGPGGNAIYALDVTDPSQFSEANAARIVVGEWGPSNISCVNSAGCQNNLGNTYGVPVIRRLHSGSWAVIFGNGFNSPSGDAGLFIMLIDPTSGAKSFYYLSTGTGGTNNGIAYPSPADLDGDHITDYVYAGDLLGNVWKFDLTDTNPANWRVNASPIFTDPAGRPITTKLDVAIIPQTSGPLRLMLDFGTGRKIPLTTTTPAQYDSGQHYLYGIWDWNMGSWNAQSSLKYASMASGPPAVDFTNLQAQTLSFGANSTLDASNNKVCFADQTACAATPQYGWYIALLGANEQVIFNPLQYQDAFLVNTTIPPTNSPLQCTVSTETGFTIGVSVKTGAPITKFFPLYNDTAAVGSQTNASGTPFIVLAGGLSYMLTETIGNGNNTGPILCPPGSPICSSAIQTHGPTGRRLTWIERR